MQMNRSIIVVSLLASLASSGCYSPDNWNELLAANTDGSSGTDTDDDSATTWPGTTLTDGGSAGSDSDSDSGGSRPQTPAATDEDVGYDRAPEIESLTIDGKAKPITSIKTVHTALIEVLASDDRVLESVSLLLDDNVLATLTEPPYTYAWTIDDIAAKKPVELRAVARDNSGQETSASTKISFNLPKGGTLIWSDTGPQPYTGAVDDLTISPAGSIIAAGSRSHDPEEQLAQAVVRCMKPLDGQLELNIAYPADDDLDGAYRARAVAVMTDGRIAVAGSMVPEDDPSHSPRPWLATFTPTGEFLDAKTFNTYRGTFRDLVAIGPNLVLAGEIYGDGKLQAWITSTDDTLVPRWQSTLELPEHEWASARALAIAEDGSLYLAGTFFDGTHRAIAAQISLGHGEILWSGPLPILGNGGDYGEALVIGSSGNLLVGGAVRYKPDDPKIMSLRWLSPVNGESITDITIPSIGATDQSVTALTTDHWGRVYVTGTIHGEDDDQDTVVYKRSLDGGASIWKKIHDSGNDGYDRGAAIVVDVHGLVYAAGSRNSDGSPQWWVQGHHP